MVRTMTKEKYKNTADASSLKEKNIASKFSVHVIVRMFHVLYENGKTKRTNLSGKSGLSYNKCIKYVNLMLLLGWIRSSDDDDGYQLSLTERGAEIMKILEKL